MRRACVRAIIAVVYTCRHPAWYRPMKCIRNCRGALFCAILFLGVCVYLERAYSTIISLKIGAWSFARVSTGDDLVLDSAIRVR